MTELDEARLAPGVRAQVAEQFARYRAASRAGAPFDECGRPTRGFYDELVGDQDQVRPMWAELSAAFAEHGVAGLADIDHRVRRQIEDDGVTYTGPDGDARPWRLDPIPLLVSADDWTRLEAGLVQRSRVLDEVLTDVYGPRRLLSSGVLPPEVVFGNAGYVRAAHGITVPGTHQLFLHACDISRFGDGDFRVLADWAQAPSGAGYALADRRVVASAIPESFEHAGPRPLSPFARAMRLMLAEAAPVSADGTEPVVVVLSPGTQSETAFDQAYLAQTLGFPLVESADLVVRDGALWMRSLGSLERVDVVLRRVDAEFADPLDLRPDSRLGVVGLVEVLRRGAVTVVNTLGSGLLESPALSVCLPRIARTVLGEELLLDSVPSYWGGSETERAHLVSHLDELVIRSAVDGSAIFGPNLTAAERTELAARIEAETWRWVGQEPAEFSVAPSVRERSGLAPAPVGMRLFSLARRGGYTAMAGGLGQQWLRREPGHVAIKVAAKDVWVRAAPATAPAAAELDERVRRVAPVVEAVSSPRVLNDLFWMGRYGERAESVVRQLAATHDVYQDYRYRPWMEGGAALPVLLRALATTTGTDHPVLAEADGPADRSARVSADGANSVVGASPDGFGYLAALTGQRQLPGSLAYAIEHYGAAARAVRDQVSGDTWMILGAVDRALAEFRGAEGETAMSSVHSQSLAALLALSGIGAESLVRDTGWQVMEIGKRIERGLALTALLESTLAREQSPEAEQVLFDAVLAATESAVMYRRRHRGAPQIAALAELLLFDAANPRSLVYQLDRLEVGFQALPGSSGTSRSQRLLADAQRMVRRVDPAELEQADDGVRTELVELLEGVHLRLRKLAESFETTKLTVPQGFQPLWGTTRIVG
ncbi:circularly permuted type 2 ATP-grasp protein [Nocardia caishijiensis]|uniref:Circularly permuted ATP-grasp superfamily protein n=1 Tax=Nocardia caishijiensis TaxID=184756 RepID=A0ABQ6YFI2_9NOCA|nr:circularly permuted type 2 ATP-grasp protein [Nocardia caishijiensis]KAF0836734.1 putative circularly permuted ATP-grasp superfamily protein [Nocardia caishijiensis]